MSSGTYVEQRIDYWSHWRGFCALAAIGSFLTIFIGGSLALTMLGNGLPLLLSLIVSLIPATAISLLIVSGLYYGYRKSPDSVRHDDTTIYLTWRRGQKGPKSIDFNEITKIMVSDYSRGGMEIYLRDGRMIPIEPGFTYSTPFVKSLLESWKRLMESRGMVASAQAVRILNHYIYSVILKEKSGSKSNPEEGDFHGR